MNLTIVSRAALSLFLLTSHFVVTKAETITATHYAGGTGTKEDPYQVATLAQLRKLSETPEDWDKSFIQTADIEASDTRTWNMGDHDRNPATPDVPMGFSPIGDNILHGNRQKIAFTGHYNGMGHRIDQLFINRPQENYVGLFGYLYGDTDWSTEEIVNFVAITNVDISGNNKIGVLAGESVYTRIVNCYTTGRVSGEDATGGLVGSCGHAQHCYSLVSVNSAKSRKGALGIGMWNTNGSSHVNCYYNSDVYSDDNLYGYGYPLTTSQMGLPSNFKNWVIEEDASLVQGAPPVLVNEGSIVRWKMNPLVTHSLQVTVTTAQGAPIKGAIIYHNGKVATDASGTGVVPVLPNSTVSFDIEASGMMRYSGAMEIADKDETLSVSLIQAYGGGTGTYADPFQIGNLEQLGNLSKNTHDWAASFIQMADIDASATRTWNVGDHDNRADTPDEAMGFSPIGSMRPGGTSLPYVVFSGNYNGNGYGIDGLFINRPAVDYVGLFGFADGTSSTIKNLALRGADVTGKANSGILAGSSGYTKILGSFTTGTVKGTNKTGGLVGQCMYAQNCYSLALVSCAGLSAGGLGTPSQFGVNGTFHQNCFFNSEAYTGALDSGFGSPLSASEMGMITNYVGWNVEEDATLVQGAPPVLMNEGGVVKWKMNPIPTLMYTFIISDEKGQMIEGAEITCNGKRTTDIEGKGFCQMLPNTSAEYKIVALGKVSVSGTVSIGEADAVTSISLVDAYAAGSGTEADPFQIATLNHLRNLSENPIDWKSFFIQTDNIDASDTRTWNMGDHDNNLYTPDEAMGFSPIGDSSQGERQQVVFNGSYNGQGYRIEGLFINRPHDYYVGLFGNIEGSSQSRLENVALVGADVRGEGFTGILAGRTPYIRIANCYTSGSVRGWVYSGSLVGRCAYAQNCYSSATVTETMYVKGGLGTSIWTPNGSYHQNCYYNGDDNPEIDADGYGFPLTTDQMHQRVSYENWDFVGESINGTEDIWAISPAENGGYPYHARGRQPIELILTSGQVDYSGQGEAFPIGNISGIPANGTARIVYRLSNQVPEADWSSAVPVNTGVYDVKVSVGATDTHLANELVVNQAWTINRLTPVITFSALENKTFGDAAFQLSATTNGDGVIVYSSSDENVVTVNGATVTILGAGSANITASLAETNNCFAAVNVVQPLTVSKAAGNISWSIHSTTITVSTNADPFVLASAQSTMPGATISYRSSDASVATVNPTTGEVAIVGSGACSITATAEAAHYLSVEAVVYLSVSTATSIGEVESSSPSIYPNPATSTIFIRGCSDKKVVIYRLSGQKVLEVSCVTQVDVSHLERGVYIIKVGEKNIEKIVLK